MKTYLTSTCFTSKHFSYRDSDIDNWLPKEMPVLEDKPITIYKTKSNQTFKEMFQDAIRTDTEEVIRNYCFSLQQIEKMCEDNDKRLDKDWWNFFPVTDGKNVFVLLVSWNGGRWRVRVGRLGHDDVWLAGFQLFLRNAPVPLPSPDTLTASKNVLGAPCPNCGKLVRIELSKQN